MKEKPVYIPVLEFLQRQLQGTLDETMTTHMNYPTAISRLPGFSIVDVGEATATLALDADPALHGNQQGTVHGGLLCELADAAIGTAHSTLMKRMKVLPASTLKPRSCAPYGVHICWLPPGWNIAVKRSATTGAK